MASDDVTTWRKSTPRRVNVYLPDDLWARLERVRERAVARGYRFNVSSETQKALAASLDRLEEELDHADRIPAGATGRPR